ncbi:MAG: hypothetical protein WCV50_06540 [Patescibacteria group bacterium]|jgi:hypothetical protein
MTLQNTIAKKVVTFTEPRIDDYLGLEIARRFGDGIWPGIKTALIAPRDGSRPQKMSTSLYFRHYGQLWLGIGEENVGQPVAATIADLTDTSSNRKVKMLVDLANTATTGKSSPLNLGHCVYLLTHVGWEPWQIESWLNVFFDAFFNPELTIRPHQPASGHQETGLVFPIIDRGARILDSLYHRWLREKTPELAALDQLKRMVNAAGQSQPSRILNLAEGVALLCATSANGQEAAYNWIAPVFNAAVRHQQDFVAAVNILKKLTPRTTGCHQFLPDGDITVLAVDSQRNPMNNRCLTAAARYLDLNLDLLVVQRATGHIQIIGMSQLDPRYMQMITRAIRLEEMHSAGAQADFSFEQLAKAGLLAGCPAWFYQTNGHTPTMLANGSFTLPNVPVTCLSVETVLQIIRSILRQPPTEEGWADWLKG